MIDEHGTQSEANHPSHGQLLHDKCRASSFNPATIGRGGRLRLVSSAYISAPVSVEQFVVCQPGHFPLLHPLIRHI